jgi:hypothetical protein
MDFNVAELFPICAAIWDKHKSVFVGSGTFQLKTRYD